VAAFRRTSNYFSRTLDRDRLHAPDEVSLLEQVRAQIPGSDTEQIERFIEGFPAATWRYIPRPKLPRSW